MIFRKFSWIFSPTAVLCNAVTYCISSLICPCNNLIIKKSISTCRPETVERVPPVHDRKMSTVDDCICVTDFELLAETTAPKNPLIFVNSGATDEQTLRENLTAFKSWRFQPKVLRDVSSVDTSISIFGKKAAFPVGVAPTGLMKMYSNGGGELDAANAAANLGTIFTQSTWASASIEEIATEIPSGLKWFQLYVLTDMELTKNLVRRAEKNGFEAIVLTIDCAAVGKRYKIVKDFKFPTKVVTRNFDGRSEDGAFYKLRYRALSWKNFDWLKSITNLPIIIKGILTPEAALEAVQHGAAGVWVSNHGGRQLDGVLPTIIALPQIVKAVQGKCKIFFDGGIRNGGDVAKAIALGADAVFVARPIIWGVTCGGISGAHKVLQILRDEFELTMKLLGVTSIKELQLSPDLVIHESKLFAKL